MPKPTADELAALCPEVDRATVERHIHRLDELYFERFSREQIAQHLRGLAALDGRNPVEVMVRGADPGRVEVIVLAADVPSAFSLITGVLAGMGLSVDSGEVFTYGRDDGGGMRTPFGRRRTPRRRRHPPTDAAPRMIIDHFVGQLESAERVDAWAGRLRTELRSILERALRGGDQIKAARKRVNEMVTRALGETVDREQAAVQPVELEVDTEAGPFTRLRVVSHDTPAFLYALSAALALHELSVEHVGIRTHPDGRIEDEIDFVDKRGRPVTDSDTLSKVRLSVLLTKQFTYFLNNAPDPYAALSRFEQLSEQIVNLPESGQWIEQLADPNTMQDLARLFGASDYLWEDFIQLRYEALLPMLRPRVAGRRFSVPSDRLPEELERELEAAPSPSEKRKALNRFKDKHIFLIDLDHILTPGSTFRRLAEQLTALAELVVRKASELVRANMVEQHGVPRTAEGAEATYAVLGLGKLGGAALGYASDIELMYVYEGAGHTDGRRSIETARFFERMVQEVSRFIEAKREGIFRVDLRLRPYGNDGPPAVRYDLFDRYFAPAGPGHAMERLALVRMRAIGGDEELGRRIEEMRDRYLYGSPEALDLDALFEVRARAYRQKARGRTFNAKQGCGGLLDLEMGVQTLQVLHGGEHTELRTPRIHEALNVLARIGGLSEHEAAAITDAYDFLRQLINGLRMLRGNALDLFLPAADSDEYEHLARRMGYERRKRLSPSRQLDVDLGLTTATVRAFARQHFGPRAIADPDVGNVVDLLLSAEPAPALRDRVLGGIGFADPASALAHLRRLGGRDGRLRLFARLALLAVDPLWAESAPDRAVERWLAIAEAHHDPEGHFQLLLERPHLIGVLLPLLARSQPVARVLARLPHLLDWLAEPDRLLETEHLRAVEQVLGEQTAPSGQR